MPIILFELVGGVWVTGILDKNNLCKNTKAEKIPEINKITLMKEHIERGRLRWLFAGFL